MTGIKNIREWLRLNVDWKDYCKPGDIVGEDVYNYFLNILPPVTMKKDMLQADGAIRTIVNNETGCCENTYLTFRKIHSSSLAGGSLYIYCGDCFKGHLRVPEIKLHAVSDYLIETCNFVYGMQKARPRIECKDGFSLSVQAGSMFYCTPRSDYVLYYTACEVDLPSSKEELLMPYIECCAGALPTECMYPQTPIEVIEEVVKKHGGIANTLYGTEQSCSDKHLEKLWEELEDVLFIETKDFFPDEEHKDDTTLVLASDWQSFKAGTTVYEIWSWFDENYSKGLKGLMQYKN